MPGMGGPNQSRNFLLNCEGWKKIPYGPLNFSTDSLPDIRLAPITGGVENIGYGDEKQFYSDITSACSDAGVLLSIGDGTPDFKLQYGIDAVKNLKNKKAAVFIKPYPDEKYFERIEWALPVAEIIGIDIDSYNIVTMRNLVHLEKKTSEQLLKIKNHLAQKNIPFAIKGVFTPDDLQMINEVKPDIIYISNHGGRVDQIPGSTAEFLAANYKTLLENCRQLWIDGGIRTADDIKKAASYGVTTVLFGRPFISALCRSGKEAVKEFKTALSK